MNTVGILAIDGGGIRGIIKGQILVNIEAKIKFGQFITSPLLPNLQIC